jgi:hypothetical protein
MSRTTIIILLVIAFIVLLWTGILGFLIKTTLGIIAIFIFIAGALWLAFNGFKLPRRPDKSDPGTKA